MSLEFLQPDGAVAHDGRTPVARSPMEVATRADGARFEVREGWNVPVAFGEDDPSGATVGVADVSHLPKVEVQARVEVLPGVMAAASGGAFRHEFGVAQRIDGAWWCLLKPDRALLLGGEGTGARQRVEAAADGAEGYVSVLDLRTAYGALTVVGPQARETFARFTALDLRPKSTPVGGLRPGSVARTPGLVIREDEDRFLMVFGAALGQYVWEQVLDAARRLGGGPIGVDRLGPLGAREAGGAGAAPSKERLTASA